VKHLTFGVLGEVFSGQPTAEELVGVLPQPGRRSGDPRHYAVQVPGHTGDGQLADHLQRVCHLLEEPLPGEELVVGNLAWR